jgi:YHS domain-containing protein
MKARRIFAALSIVSLVTVGALVAAENEEKSEKKEFKATCPVSGQPAIEDSVLDLEKLKAGKGKVYFCCKNCPKAFEKDPAKFELKTKRQLAETGQVVQVGCPISGQPVNEETLVDVGTTKVGFCCKNCLAKYNEADEDGKLKVVFANFDKGFTWQTLCPVSGHEIDPKQKVEYDGKKVYFCCEHCIEAFNKEPKKFLEKLPQFAKADEAAEKKE